MRFRRKIAIVGPVYPYRGGIAHFSETLFWRLRARRHTVTAITFTRQYPNMLFPGKSQYEAGPVARPVPSVRLIDSINPLTWYRTVGQVARWEPDVVIIPYWMPFFAPSLGTIARRLRAKGVTVLAIVHNAIPHERHFGDKVLSRSFLRAAHGCIVMSDEVGRDLDVLGIKAPRKLVNHPVYDKFGQPMDGKEARAALGLPPEAPVLLFFGFIRRYKGLHVLLECMPSIVATLPQVRLVIAGEFYEDEARYRSLIESAGLAPQILLHANYIPMEDVKKYFAAADVVVQPYITATQSGVAQVAFHFEKPLIITDVGGLAEIVGHEEAGLVVPPEDPQAIASAVVRFFQEDLQARLSNGVQRKKRAHSWDHFCDALEDMM